MSNNSKFDFYEKVRVVSISPSKAQIVGEIGAILGKANNEHGEWSYAVHIYRDKISWQCTENELESTGEFDKRESFYDGSSIRVSSRGQVLQQGAAQHGVPQKMGASRHAAG